MPEEKSEPKDKTILVVDDDESICAFLKILLGKDGFCVEIAGTGAEAMKVVGSKKVDLVILDWMMPSVSGYEVVKMLQEDEYRQIPVIIITARVTDRDTIEMIRQELNVADFVAKPIQHAVFMNRIHQILNTLSPVEKRIREQMQKNNGISRY